MKQLTSDSTVRVHGFIATKRFRLGACLIFLSALLPAFFMAGRASAAPIAGSPPLSLRAEPEEGGKLVYLPISPENADSDSSHMFGFELIITNSSAGDLTLNTLRVTLTAADDAVSLFEFAREVTVPAESQVSTFIDPDETIEFMEEAPVSVELEVFVDEYTKSVSRTYALVPYQTKTYGGSYLFPANADDLGPDRYFSHIARHTGGGQYYGYDLNVQGWDAANNTWSSIVSGGDPKVNEDRHGWNVPIYAMADGVVLSASNGWEDNPVIGWRIVQNLDSYSAGGISEVKVTRFSDTRAASVVRLPSDALKVIIWDTEDTGRQIIRRGELEWGSATAVAADALTANRLVTATKTDTDELQVIIWDVSEDGMTVTRRIQTTQGPIKEVSMIKLGTGRFATVVRTDSNEMRVIVWDVSDDGSTLYLRDDAVVGDATSIAPVALSGSRLVTAFRNGAGNLRLVAWDVADDGTISELGGVNSVGVAKVTALKVSGTALVTAVRKADGDLRLIRWTVDEDGMSITQDYDEDAGAIQDLSLTEAFGGAVLTSVKLGSGALKNIIWDMDADKNDFVRFGEAEGEVIGQVSTDQTESGVVIGGLQTAGGDLKMRTWRLGSGGGNNVVVLHGDCRVLYAHFRHGTLNPAVAYPGALVKAGQLLGRMGNSGSSSGPHTHIHATRVASGFSVEEAIALTAEDTLPLRGYRPIPFHCARTMLLSQIQLGGEGNEDNAFTTMSGHGVYFETYGIRPHWLQDIYVDGSSLCLFPTGRQHCIGGQIGFGGPLHEVEAAVADKCWQGTLYIRDGSYNETPVFDRTMTIRSYDGIAIIGK